MSDLLANEREQAVGNKIVKQTQWLLLFMETQSSSSVCCKLTSVYYAMEKVQGIFKNQLKEQDDPELLLRA